MPLLLCRPKDAASRKSFDTNRTLRRWANRGCYRQPVNKRPVYAACTRQCVSSAFGVFGSAEIKDLACCQHLGKFNSVPGHQTSKDLSRIPENPSAQAQPMIRQFRLRVIILRRFLTNPDCIQRFQSEFPATNEDLCAATMVCRPRFGTRFGTRCVPQVLQNRLPFQLSH